MRTGLLDPRKKTILLVCAAAGAAAFFAALRQDAPRAWANLLLGNFYFLSLSLSGVVIIAIQYVSRAGWPTLFRRIPEAMTAYLPAGAVLTGLTFFGMHDLYHWAHPDAAAHDAILAAKHAYLNIPMYFLRAALFIGGWMLLTHLILSRSRAQDRDGRESHTHENVGLSALFLVFFAFTFSLASVDWLMSLEPHWYSTIYPWYVFNGLLVHGFAAITLLLILLRRKGLFQETNKHHFHDLGKFIFAFSVFWGYLWYSQYLLIWYANIPEETAYFIARAGDWSAIFWINPIVNLGLPFVILLTASAKQSGERGGKGMLAACALVLLGRWIDLYQIIMPSIMQGTPRFGWQEIFIFLGVGAIFLILFDRTFRAHGPVPEKDPYLGESRHHHAS